MHKYLAKRFNKLGEDRMRFPKGITTLIPNRESTEGPKFIDLRIVCLHYKKLKFNIRKRM